MGFWGRILRFSDYKSMIFGTALFLSLPPSLLFFPSLFPLHTLLHQLREHLEILLPIERAQDAVR